MAQEQIRAINQIKENSIVPNLIDYAGSAPTNGKILSYNQATNKFEWTTVSGLEDHYHPTLPSITITGDITVTDKVILTLNDSSTLDQNIVWYSGATVVGDINMARESDIDYLDVEIPSKPYPAILSLLAKADDTYYSSIVIRADSGTDSASVTCIADSDASEGIKNYITLAGERIVIQGYLDMYNNGIQFRTTNSPETPNFANGGTLFVSSGILKFIDYPQTTSNIVITPDSDYMVSKGWIKTSDTWTYASASTFTISGDKTSIYTLGTRIRWTQTSIKYGIVLSSSYSDPNTTVTIVVNTDYTIANAVISDNYYSYQDHPFGYPDWFNYTPTLVGWSVAPTNQVSRFKVEGRTCTVAIRNDAGTSDATSATFSCPINVVTMTDYFTGTTMIYATDNSVVLTGASRCYVTTGATVITCNKDMSGALWTASGTKNMGFAISYEI